MPLMLSQERQARLVCPFCGHNYGNYVKSKNKRHDSSFWNTRGGGQQRLVEIMSSKESGFQPNSELTVLQRQELWEVQDVSQQTTDNDAKEKEKEVEIEEEKKKEEHKEEEEEEEGRDASVPKVFQNLSKETMSQHSEGCTFCSSQVKPNRCYETQHFELSDLDYDSNWSIHNNHHYNHHPYSIHRKTRLYD
ncbi:hypothetical protein M0804_009932 [Polistes exclamans]|nr:hypothetical protein M0804_009932 [Polistes exclamans]